MKKIKRVKTTYRLKYWQDGRTIVRYFPTKKAAEDWAYENANMSLGWQIQIRQTTKEILQ